MPNTQFGLVQYDCSQRERGVTPIYSKELLGGDLLLICPGVPVRPILMPLGGLPQRRVQWTARGRI